MGILGHGVGDPTGPAGDTTPEPRLPAESPPAAAERTRTARRGVRHGDEREEGPRRGQRATADTAAGDYVACRRGTVSSYPRRPPRSDWPELPAEETYPDFSPRLLFRFSSPPDSATFSRVSSLSLSLSPPLFFPLSPADCIDSRLSVIVYLGHLANSI